MHIQIVAVGKLKEVYLTKGIAEYAKRLAPYIKLTISEVADEKAPEQLSASEEAQVKQREGERILSQIKPDTYIIAADIQGELWTSEKLARHVEDLATYGRSQIAFVIGGSLGLSEEVLKRAHLKISFGRFTYPHQLLRLVLVEQVYRVVKILRGETYHK